MSPACSFRGMPFSRAPSVLTLRVQTASIKGWPLTSIPHSRTGTILSSLLVRRWPMMFHPQVLCSSFFIIWTLQKSSAVGQITLGNGHRCALLFSIEQLLLTFSLLGFSQPRLGSAPLTCYSAPTDVPLFPADAAVEAGQSVR